jgi:hypothetical protein
MSKAIEAIGQPGDCGVASVSYAWGACCTAWVKFCDCGAWRCPQPGTSHYREPHRPGCPALLATVVCGEMVSVP